MLAFTFSSMKPRHRTDKKIHIRKKVAAGTTGAVLGAVVGGPVGALVGGVVGTAVGNAAERGTLAKLASEANRNRIAQKAPAARKVVHKAKQKARTAKAVVKKTKRSAQRAARNKPKAKSRR